MSDLYVDYEKNPRRGDDGDDRTETPRRDFVGHERRRRGGCLTALLGLNLLGGACVVPFFFFLIASGAPSTQTYQSVGLSTTVVYLYFFIYLAGLICYWGLWRWKRWGYLGLIIGHFISIGLANTLSETDTMLRSMLTLVISLSLLIWLVNPIEHHLE